MATEEEKPEIIEEAQEQAEEQNTNDTSETVKSVADRLLELKQKTDQQRDEIEILKSKIKPAVINQPIKTSKGIVTFVSGSSSKFLDRNLVRQVLMDKLGVSPERAEQIIDAGSTEKVIASYVKVTPA